MRDGEEAGEPARIFAVSGVGVEQFEDMALTRL
jgi:hypothetical protein